ncbi:major facilitator superfamily domain-containing protein [Roridomyces roridus]|uniref:Major facilitator superfamily domain-containing protein n=1 Tax=Roridomyces roridus TaxID=1738132 RepID=A0AAD7CL96_9AGAR|nr:major facilitator superfamily domain-containing protein [Roridomyces roridus]
MSCSGWGPDFPQSRHPRLCTTLLAPLGEPVGSTADIPPLSALQSGCNIGCTKSPTYSTMALSRAITAFFISPASAIGSAVVSETFFKRERATYMGIWTIMVTCGVPVAPFIFGFLSQRVNYRWIYWVLAMVNGVQFILYFIFGAETLYIHDPQKAKPGFLGFRRIDPRPLTLEDFVHPFRFLLKPGVCLPAISHAMIFLWASIMPNILMPQIFPAKFGLDTQQVGLQFLAAILGSVIGEQLGGRTTPPEYRLWLSYIGFVLSIVGVVVFCVQVERARRKWNITPLVGVAIASVGNQLSTTVLITYAVDCYRLEAASVGVFISFVRQIWGFIEPFLIPNLIAATSFDATAGIAAASMVVFFHNSYCLAANAEIFPKLRIAEILAKLQPDELAAIQRDHFQRLNSRVTLRWGGRD